jgi:hypothetical protein
MRRGERLYTDIGGELLETPPCNCSIFAFAHLRKAAGVTVRTLFFAQVCWRPPRAPCLRSPRARERMSTRCSLPQLCQGRCAVLTMRAPRLPVYCALHARAGRGVEVVRLLRQPAHRGPLLGPDRRYRRRRRWRAADERAQGARSSRAARRTSEMVPRGERRRPRPRARFLRVQPCRSSFERGACLRQQGP